MHPRLSALAALRLTDPEHKVAATHAAAATAATDSIATTQIRTVGDELGVPGRPERPLRVADEEAQHFTLLHAHLQDMGWRYGDFPGHDGLWSMCEKTKDDVLARMALVPRTLEARGLDATPLIQAKLKRVDTPDALRAVEILDIILRDEVGHVAIGNRWYRWLCERAGCDPEATYPELVARYEAPRLKPPFNLEARGRAGFSPEELRALSAGGKD